MTAAHELLGRLAALGATAEAAGDRLVLRAGAKMVPADLVADLRQLKSEALTALGHRSQESATYWQARHSEALRYSRAFHATDEAAQIAWGEMENLWHKRYGKRVPPGICGGCGRSTANTDILSLSDGTGVHISSLECVIAYGDHWRGAATKALVALGLMPPQEKT